MSQIQIMSAEQAVCQNKNILNECQISEVAVVKNLDFIRNPYDFYPLFPKASLPLQRICGIAVDMDGTSTTTEPLALHSLEYMVRKITDRMSVSQWSGLDEYQDHPHIIGSSNFMHVEFLLKAYQADIREAAFRDAFFEALFWTQAYGTDERRREICQTAINCGLGELLRSPEFLDANRLDVNDGLNLSDYMKPELEIYGGYFSPSTYSARVSAALDIYYTRYHYILREIGCGRGAELSKSLLGDGSSSGNAKTLVGPMPGLGVFLSLVKGWLGEEADQLLPILETSYPGHAPSGSEGTANRLAGLPDSVAAADFGGIGSPNALNGSADRLGFGSLNVLSSRFQDSPVKLALVTASIYYEAHTVMTEVFRILKQEISAWPISESRKEMLIGRFSDYTNVFDAFVTATDASESRLKPHRDLYSIALYQMAIAKEEYANCVAFEDTAPGVVSARAAGFGTTIALPNHDTRLQDYSTASAVVTGLPETILRHHIFLGD